MTPNDTNFDAFQRGYASAVRQLQELFQVAMQSGVRDLPDDAAGRVLAEPLVSLLRSPPATESEVEFEGWARGLCAALAGLAWKGYKAVEPAPTERGLH